MHSKELENKRKKIGLLLREKNKKHQNIVSSKNSYRHYFLSGAGSLRDNRLSVPTQELSQN